MRAEAELAELVEDHLGRNANVTNVALASTIHGLAQIMTAYGDAQARRGNWGAMLANLKNGIANIQPALPVLRGAGPGVAAIVSMAERELQFASVMQDSIVRLQADESTLA